MDGVLGILGILTVILGGILAVDAIAVSSYGAAGWIYAGSAIGSGITLLAFSEMLKVLKEIRDSLKVSGNQRP